MMLVYYGVVKDRVVVLPEGVDLIEGLEVEVRVRSPKRPRLESVLPEDIFKQSLLESGLLQEIKTPALFQPSGDRTPIRVEGKPLSQMIIEERR